MKRRRLTRNRMGWASEQLSPLSELFIKYASRCCRDASSPALDLGAAYGTAALAALHAGCHVIANDLDAVHLTVLSSRLDDTARPRLSIRPGRFPRQIAFHHSSLGAAHASNVFHFLTGNQLDFGLRELSRWLRPGAKLFVQAATPYQQPFAGFLPEYQRRLEAGIKWPGWIPKISAFSSHRQLSQMPRSIHLLDANILSAAARRAGFEIERVWLYRRPDLPVSLHLDGRESVGLVARRPHS
ncbi:MAG: class I SAM-dependent methyltransferase [Bryobacterales bacterium]|nr:class I SAM-dependent methyltransferase [Bryobacterales bacterium]